MKNNFRFLSLRWSLILLLGVSTKAAASVDVYLGLNLGSVLMREMASDTESTYQSLIFVGHWGYGLGTRIKAEVGSFGLGFVGEYDWIGDSMERKLTGEGDSSIYRNEFNRSIGGATASINTGASSIIFEYYPFVQNIVSYSDGKATNPFRKGDKLDASGFGFGFVFGNSNGFAYQLLYKNIQYQKAIMSGAEATFPNDQFKTIKLDEVTIGFVLKF